jgi:hypothetical protein
MNTETKTHYRRVFKSDHLGVADIEDFIEAGSNLIFTITHVRQEFDVMVAGRKGNFNIAYFKEKIKPLVLNATNSKIMRQFSNGSSFVEDWKNITVQLYIDPTAKLKGEIVGGVRINPNKPRAVKKEITKNNQKAWENAKAAYVRDGNFDAVEKRAVLSDENKAVIVSEVANA